MKPKITDIMHFSNNYTSFRIYGLAVVGLYN
jgi:hypothetical protein